MSLLESWFPLSHGQEALWFLSRLAPQTWTYNIVLPVRIRGRLDAPALRRALQALSDRHPSLRTEFTEEGGSPRQRAIADHQVLLDEVDATGWSDAAIEEALTAEAHRPFDLETSAVLRAKLFRRAADDHVFVFVVHHIASDLWSIVVAMDELQQLYTGKTLPSLPTTYEEYVVRQREWVASDAADEQWRYWRDELSDEIPVLDLPADHRRPRMQSFRGGWVIRRIDADLYRSLKQLAGKERTTPFMALLAAYQALLHRYTGQESFVVGSPTSGRERPELQGIIGDFVNMVPLKADLGGRPSFRQLLARVRAGVVGTIRHQDYPFSLLVDRLHQSRDLSRSPIFQTTFVLQKFHRYGELSRVMLPAEDEPSIPFANLVLEPIALPQQSGQFDLNLEMKEDDAGRLVGAWKYAADLFEPETIERMAGHFETLLRSIVADPDRPIAELRLLTDAERRTMIHTAQGPRVEPPAEASVVELFEAEAARHPDSIAVTCGEESLTYGALRDRMQRVARALVRRGVGRDAIVAVLLPRGIDFITALLAVNRAGGAFLPLDAKHPVSRTQAIIESSGARIVLTSIDDLEDTDADLPSIAGEDLAYVMYTSGSTGKPKGVMVEHRGMVNHVLGKLEDLGMDASDVLAQNGPPTFDIVVWQCLAPLVVGGRVVVFPDEVVESPSRMLADIERHGVTVLQMVPSLLGAVLDEATSRPDLPSLASLRWMVPTGEALPADLSRRWLEAYPHIPLLNTYGSTECSDDQCHYVVPSPGLRPPSPHFVGRGPLAASPSPLGEGRRWREAPDEGCVIDDDASPIVSIGTPIRNMAAYVLDTDLEPVPVGVVGELYIGGIGVGRGYIGDPDRTAAAFVTDPFFGARLYRTRDMVRRRADSTLSFLGRTDDIIKLHGFRIEPGEIVAALRRHPAISEAAVLAREIPKTGRVLVGYVVAARGADAPQGDELRRFAAERLPQYMVPSTFVVLDALPLTPNGKLDHKRLPLPQWQGMPEELVAPRTPTEERIAAIWAEILGLDEVGVTQDFFAIGGDSIRSIRIVARCKRANLHVRPSDLFQYPTVAALAALADSAPQIVAETAAPALHADEDTYPLSSMQQGMLFHSIAAQSKDVYVQQLSARLRGPLDVVAFERAWEEMIRRHEVLRTAFAWRGLAEPLQIVGKRVRLPLEVLDAPEARLEELRAAQRNAGFDLGRAPLMRLVLVRLSDTESELIWTWHHIILDAWSVPILFEELFKAYRGVALGPPPPPYKEFVAWQRSSDRREAEAFWRAELDGFHEPTPLGVDVPTGETGYGLEFIDVPFDEIEELRNFARRARVTLNTIVQGAWALLLSRYSGRDDVLFGTAVAGRPPEIAGVERMVGLLINTLPLRVNASPSQRVSAWLQELQRRQAETRRHEQAPLADVQAWSPLGRGAQLFESLLVVENLPLDHDLELGEFEFVERANFPLTILFELRTKCRLGAGWDRSRFDGGTILRMLGHIRRLLLELARGPERELADLEPWSAVASATAFKAAADAAALQSAPIHRLFEAVARDIPDAIAAVFAGDVQLTYRELNAHANHFARALQAKGIGIEDRVVVCMDGSLERLIAILGIMKAGAAYVPLDVTTPEARRREMIDDCCAKLVVDEVEEGEDENLEDTATPENLAYIIYTSGSTGRPKGVAIEHRSLRHLVESQIRAFRIDRSSRVLQFASLSFDASVSEIFTALLAGATLYMAPRRMLVPSRDLIALMQQWQITTVTFPPSVLSRLPSSELPSLRTLVSAGEPCTAELAAQWAPGRLFLNAYGPTEVTVCATIGEVRPDGSKPTIGRAMGDARLYILDDRLRPVAIGVAGELCVGGPGVARGYWNRPEQTAAAFVRDPFSPEPDARMYRTGDLARFLPSGELEFLGRRDEQVKVRGFRIEPAEIEAALRRDPALKDAAVVAEEANGERRLVAYVVPRRDKAPEWWPSIAEYFVYDELAYHAMTSDERRNESYRAAMREKVRDKVVVEVGTGPEALLSRFCAEAGARKVYALEILPETYQRAAARVRELGLEDRIEVILGDATKIELPEPAEVCVSEIVGAIGGCEGAAVIMNGVRRLLAPDAEMIPARSTTLYAPVQLPDALRRELAFAPLPARYVDRIFAEIGYPFDLRLCAKGLDRSHLLGAPQIFEDLDYRGVVDAEVRHRAEHVIERNGRLDGFLVWLTLDTGGGEQLDILDHEHCWLPVFFPAFEQPIEVVGGDRIEALAGAVLCDGLHPDYFIEGTLRRAGEPVSTFRYDAPRHARRFRATPFYRELFRDGEIPRIAERTQAVRQRLRELLPDYMVPEAIVELDELPLLPSGKLDRRGLAAAAKPAAPSVVIPLRNDAERAVARIWQDLLQTGEVGRETNFFDHGGHSLLLLRVQDRLRQDLGVDVAVADLFANPTVASLAGRISRAERSEDAAAATRQRAAARQQGMQRIAGRRRGAEEEAS